MTTTLKYRNVSLDEIIVSNSDAFQVVPTELQRPGGTLWTTGNFFTAGYNFYGGLGQNDTSNRADLTTLFTGPSYVDTVQSFCASYYGGGYVLLNGTLWTWGYNAQGQLGQNDTSDRSVATQIGSMTDWSKFTSSDNSGFGIKTDGTLWAWGYNAQGQLGLGDRTNRSSPVQVGLMTDWKHVFAQGAQSFAGIKTDGSLWTWGQNTNGELGQGDVTHRSSPVQVGSLTDWKQVSAGRAIKTDGSLWTWGENTYGQLGLGDVTHRSSPVQVGSLTNWKQVNSIGAIKTDGTMWNWGQNNYRQLGLGDFTHRSSPVQVGSMTDWASVGRTNNNTFTGTAIKTDGTLWTWGLNSFGQASHSLGVGNPSVPLRVGSAKGYTDTSRRGTWLQVAHGSVTIMAMRDIIQ